MVTSSEGANGIWADGQGATRGRVELLAADLLLLRCGGSVGQAPRDLVDERTALSSATTRDRFFEERLSPERRTPVRMHSSSLGYSALALSTRGDHLDPLLCGIA
jgi:hypothetical protein